MGDIVVFDSDQIASRFTVREPRNYPVGIAHVLVIGIAVAQNELD